MILQDDTQDTTAQNIGPEQATAPGGNSGQAPQGQTAQSGQPDAGERGQDVQEPKTWQDHVKAMPVEIQRELLTRIHQGVVADLQEQGWSPPGQTAPQPQPQAPQAAQPPERPAFVEKHKADVEKKLKAHGLNDNLAADLADLIAGTLEKSVGTAAGLTKQQMKAIQETTKRLEDQALQNQMQSFFAKRSELADMQDDFTAVMMSDDIRASDVADLIAKARKAERDSVMKQVEAQANWPDAQGGFMETGYPRGRVTSDQNESVDRKKRHEALVNAFTEDTDKTAQMKAYRDFQEAKKRWT